MISVVLEYKRDVVHLLDIMMNRGRTFDVLMTSLGFLRLSDDNSGRLADHDRIQAAVSDDRLANDRALARGIAHRDRRHSRADDNALKRFSAATES